MTHIISEPLCPNTLCQPEYWTTIAINCNMLPGSDAAVQPALLLDLINVNWVP